MDAALANLPADFPLGGRLLKIMPRTLGAELLFQTWLEGEAYNALLRHRKLLGEVEFQRRAEGWARDCAAGVYEWGGEASWRKFNTYAGVEKVLWLKVQEGVAEAGGAPLTEEELHQVRTRQKEVWERLLQVMNRQDFPELAEQEEGAEGGGPNGAAAPAAAGASA